MASNWQHCVRFDRPKIQTLNLFLLKQTRYRLATCRAEEIIYNPNQLHNKTLKIYFKLTLPEFQKLDNNRLNLTLNFLPYFDKICTRLAFFKIGVLDFKAFPLQGILIVKNQKKLIFVFII